VALPDSILRRVHLDAFARELPLLFEDFPRSRHPCDRRFRAVLEAVPGLAAENNLALLNLAVSLLEPGESYVEVGIWKGRSLIAAALGNDADLVGIDDFSFRDGRREELTGNLARFGIEGVTVLVGDAFRLLPEGALAGRRVGVYYYDAAHGYRAQLEGLRLIEPYLAERALLVVDDSDWKEVREATRDYLAGQPSARLLLEIEGSSHGQPQWWEGVQLIAWEPRLAGLRAAGAQLVVDAPAVAVPLRPLGRRPSMPHGAGHG